MSTASGEGAAKVTVGGAETLALRVASVRGILRGTMASEPGWPACKLEKAREVLSIGFDTDLKVVTGDGISGETERLLGKGAPSSFCLKSFKKPLFLDLTAFENACDAACDAGCEGTDGRGGSEVLIEGVFTAGGALVGRLLLFPILSFSRSLAASRDMSFKPFGPAIKH